LYLLFIKVLRLESSDPKPYIRLVSIFLYQSQQLLIFLRWMLGNFIVGLLLILFLAN